MVYSKSSDRFPAGEYDIIKTLGEKDLRINGIQTPTLNVRYEDLPPGLDLIFELPEDGKKAITDNAIVPARGFFEGRLGTDQIFYPPDWLHSAFLQLISSAAENPYNPHFDMFENYDALARKSLVNLAPVEADFNRFLHQSGSLGGLMLGGIPSNNDINRVRNEMREDMERQKLRHYEARVTQILHISIARYLTPVGIDRVDQIIDFYNQMDKDRRFWAGILNTVHLVTGGYIKSPDRMQVFATYPLS